MREDQELINRIATKLREHDLEVWLDRDSIGAGHRWKEQIREAIIAGSYFVACFSHAYTSKAVSYMNEELTLAIDQLRLRSTTRAWFIPLLLCECEVPARSIGAGETLLDLQWIDLYSDFEEGISRLVATLSLTQIARMRELIDEFGYMYLRRASAHDDADIVISSTAIAREQYLKNVTALREKYRIFYDPYKLLAKPT
jgi:TIR domain-containing protein